MRAKVPFGFSAFGNATVMAFHCLKVYWQRGIQKYKTMHLLQLFILEIQNLGVVLSKLEIGKFTRHVSTVFYTHAHAGVCVCKVECLAFVTCMHLHKSTPQVKF